MSFDALWDELASIGRLPSGGYARFAWTPADLTLREWFASAAASRGLDVVVDRAGNQWAWWGSPAASAVVTGSHLDSVPDGGAFDGPLGVVSALCAVDALHEAGFVPSRPIAVVNFADEEGARFGVACAGSRLLTGALPVARALALRDADGVTMASALRSAGVGPVGADPEALRRVGVFVELHVEQGRGLADLGAPVGVGTAIWPHGRWRASLVGEANHAGTTRLVDRHDPMLDYARLVLAARSSAEHHGAVATCGKVHVEPNGVNAIPSRVTAWLDARAPSADAVRRVVAELGDLGHGVGLGLGLDHDLDVGLDHDLDHDLDVGLDHDLGHDLGFDLVEESWTDETAFDAALCARLAGRLGGAPRLATGAGHDAGILAGAGIPAAMLFVRNPTGVSHSPAEFAERDDCLAGIGALTAVLEELAS